MLENLITDLDSHGVVTLLLTDVLVSEIKNQYNLAVALPVSDPNDYKVDVFVNRMTPLDRTTAKTTPVINIWFESSSYDKRGSTLESSRGSGVWNIDIYAFEPSRSTSTGHTKGDVSAMATIAKWAGRVRKILMASRYAYLGGTRGIGQIVTGRNVAGFTVMQPDLDQRSAQTVLGLRCAVNVDFATVSPQAQSVILEGIDVNILRASDSTTLAVLQFDY